MASMTLETRWRRGLYGGMGLGAAAPAGYCRSWRVAPAVAQYQARHQGLVRGLRSSGAALAAMRYVTVSAGCLV